MSQTTDLRSLAHNGVLRAAINTGNKALVQQTGDTLGGVSPALARRLADAIGARLQPVIYSGAGPVFDDAHKDVWDIAFLAIDQFLNVLTVTLTTARRANLNNQVPLFTEKCNDSNDSMQTGRHRNRADATHSLECVTLGTQS